MITNGALLLFEPFVSRSDGTTYNKLSAWASLQSINKFRRNQTKSSHLSIIFKTNDEKQPWILSFICSEADQLVKVLVNRLQTMANVLKEQSPKVDIQPYDQLRQPQQMTPDEVAIIEIEIENIEEEIMYLTEEEKRKLHRLYTQAIQYHSTSDRIDMDANKRVKRYITNMRRLIDDLSGVSAYPTFPRQAYSEAPPLFRYQDENLAPIP